MARAKERGRQKIKVFAWEEFQKADFGCPACLTALSTGEKMFYGLTEKGERKLCRKHKKLLNEFKAARINKSSVSGVVVGIKK